MQFINQQALLSGHIKTPNKSMRKRKAFSFENKQVAKINEQATWTGKRRDRMANTQQQAK